MAKHDQRATAQSMVCSMCRWNAGCDKCIDVTRAKLGNTHRICQCRRENHHDMVSGNGVVSTYIEFTGVKCPSPGVQEGWE